jgi:RNA polymerase sigma-70 factor, ECF subfamily
MPDLAFRGPKSSLGHAPLNVELLSPVPAISPDVDEAALLRRAREGDEGAFAELYARHHKPVYRYAARMCGPDAANDVLQETFVVILERGERFDPSRGTFGAYLFGIARHMVLRQLGPKYEVPAIVGDESPLARHQPDALDALTERERIAAVRAAIASLPPVYREVVVLCDLEELEYPAAAQIVGCPIGTIRSRLHRARALLLSKLTTLRHTQGSY